MLNAHEQTVVPRRTLNPAFHDFQSPLSPRSQSAERSISELSRRVEAQENQISALANQLRETTILRDERKDELLKAEYRLSAIFDVKDPSNINFEPLREYVLELEASVMEANASKYDLECLHTGLDTACASYLESIDSLRYKIEISRMNLLRSILHPCGDIFLYSQTKFPIVRPTFQPPTHPFPPKPISSAVRRRCRGSPYRTTTTLALTKNHSKYSMKINTSH